MTSLLQAWNELDLARHKAEFYRMWYAGHEAGMQYADVFSTIGDFRRSATVSRLRQALLAGAQQRQTITDTIRRHRDLVVPFEFALLELGEESGQLEETLKMLGDHFTIESRMMLDVKKKLAYPMATGVAAIFIAPFPILFWGNALQYAVVVAVGLTLALALGGTVLASVAGHYQKQRHVVIGRFCRALALAVEAGLGLDRVGELAVMAADDPALSVHWNRIPRQQRIRQSLAKAFVDAGVIPRGVIAALEVAEASGDYHSTVRKLADLYDER